MSNGKSLSYQQIFALCEHLQEVLDVMTEANNQLIVRLHVSETFQASDRATLNAWSQAINQAHDASAARVMDIRSSAGAAGGSPKSH